MIWVVRLCCVSVDSLQVLQRAHEHDFCFAFQFIAQSKHEWHS